jgi:uncharacterized protein (DUF2336 family)
MSDAAHDLQLDGAVESAAEAAPVHKARVALIKRLADVVSLPSSRVNAFERAITSDLLVEILREASLPERERVSRRVVSLTDIPYELLRVLLHDEITVAAPLLEEAAIPDPELISCILAATPDHRLLIARRRELSEVVVEQLSVTGEAEVLQALLRNRGARFTQGALERVMAASRRDSLLLAQLLRRPELRPSQAYVMFWWCAADERRSILQRFAVSRDVLQDATTDVYAMAAADDWSDPLVRKALQFIERRQRNRAAQMRSPFADLDAAVAAAETGMTREIAQEIGYMCGLKPTTTAKIFTDAGGEGLAVLCKSVGLSKPRLLTLWRSMRRPEQTSAGETAPALANTLSIFDMMAVDRAQTVLRYWNWALTSALTPALLQAAREGDAEGFAQYSLPERSAFLALGPQPTR